MNEFLLSTEDLKLEDLFDSIEKSYQLKLTELLENNIAACRSYLDDLLKGSSKSYYGINTGFGSLCDVSISEDELTELQNNLIRSHAAGSGPNIPKEIVKLMMLLKIKSLSFGYSGISNEIIQRLMAFYNHDIIPVVRKYGSLGASGDLAPLAHMSLPILGEGEVHYKGRILPAKEALEMKLWSPISLRSKEGIALLNGTQFCASYGVFCVGFAQDLLKKSNFISAISIDAFECLPQPFDHKIHQLRRQSGQIWVASEINKILEGSEIWSREDKRHIQDPYSFRCIPQVIGASYDAVQHVANVLQREINAVTDNPLIFQEEEEILSGGNFHAQPLALALDYLCIALAEIASISERRIYKLLNGKRGLPAYLTPESGLNSGYMIAQYTAAAIVSHNKQLCTPSSVDSIVSSNGQEDHVSMGANSAIRCYEIAQNVYRVLSIELMVAAQGLEFRRPSVSSPKIEKLMKQYREKVPILRKDRQLSIDMDVSLEFLKNLNV